MRPWPSASFRLQEARSFSFVRKCDFEERIIPLTGGDVLLYGSDVSNVAVIWIIGNLLRISSPVFIVGERYHIGFPGRVLES